MNTELRLTLVSDATFGCGDGVAGLVDEEVEHDAATGLPFVRGRTVKGLLVEECANIFFAMGKGHPASSELAGAAHFLFGRAGSTLADDARMHVGAALLPRDLRDAVAAALRVPRATLRPTDLLESLTAVRRQTAVDDATGAPEAGSLRSQRVVLRGITFASRLDFDEPPSQASLGLLAACVRGLRRGGSGRNRGRGRLRAALHNDGQDVTAGHFSTFRGLIQGG